MDTPMLKAGDQVGAYVVERTLGGGTFAMVYGVRHQVLHSRHAVKVLTPQWTKDASTRDRFLAEGRILAQLRHPNLVSVTDILTAESRVGLVMDWVDGAPLDTMIRPGGLRESQVVQLMTGMLDGIAHAHAHGVVHRDLKPENVLVAQEAHGLRPVILDFGIARVLGDRVKTQRETATRFDVLMGTPRYMSPEQVESTHTVDARTDLFALGAILYELLSGEQAFGGEGQTEILFRVSRAEHQPLDVVPPAWRPVITKALARDPADRYPTAEAFRAAVESTARGTRATRVDGLSASGRVHAGETVPAGHEGRSPLQPTAVEGTGREGGIGTYVGPQGMTLGAGVLVGVALAGLLGVALVVVAVLGFQAGQTSPAPAAGTPAAARPAVGRSAGPAAADTDETDAPEPILSPALGTRGKRDYDVHLKLQGKRAALTRCVTSHGGLYGAWTFDLQIQENGTIRRATARPQDDRSAASEALSACLRGELVGHDLGTFDEPFDKTVSLLLVPE